MKTRTLMLLLLAAAVLGALAYRSQRHATAAAGGPTTGSQVLILGDLNSITRVEVISGTQRVALVRNEAMWTVEDLWNYPADFQKLAGLLRKLDDLKVGDVIRGGASHLDEFGLATTNTGEGAQVPAEIKLYGPGGDAVADIVLGQPRAGAAGPSGFSLPDSQYARVDDGPVLVVAPYVDPLPRRTADWMDHAIVDVPASEMRRIGVALQNGEHYGVERNDEGQYAGFGTLTNTPINTQGADLWMRSFQGLSAISVAAPSSDRVTLGMEEPDVTTALTKKGLLVTAQVGSTNALGDRYASFRFSYQEPPPVNAEDTNAVAAAAAERQETEAQIERLRAHVEPWIFQLNDSAAQHLALLREQLVAANPTNSMPAAPPQAATPAAPPPADAAE